MSFSRIYNQAAARKGGEVELRAILPRVAAPGELEAMGDDRYLSLEVHGQPSTDAGGGTMGLSGSLRRFRSLPQLAAVPFQ